MISGYTSSQCEQFTHHDEVLSMNYHYSNIEYIVGVVFDCPYQSDPILEDICKTLQSSTGSITVSFSPTVKSQQADIAKTLPVQGLK